MSWLDAFKFLTVDSAISVKKPSKRDGFDADTLEDLHSRGIKTPQDLEYAEMTDAYIDLHKTLEGFSPRVEGLSLREITNRYNSLTEVA